MKAPKKISRPEKNKIKVEWADGFANVMTLEEFRNSCPCADCRNDRKGGKMKIDVMLTTFADGKFELEKLEKVGNYAICPIWKDGHDAGIFTWDYLREVFEEHSKKEQKIRRKDAHS